MSYLVSFIDFDEFFLGFRITVLVWMPVNYKKTTTSEDRERKQTETTNM